MPREKSATSVKADQVKMSEPWETPAFRFPKVRRCRWTSGGAPEPLVGPLPPPLVRLGHLGAGRMWRERRGGHRGRTLQRGGGLRPALQLLPALGRARARVPVETPLFAGRSLGNVYLVDVWEKMLLVWITFLLARS